MADDADKFLDMRQNPQLAGGWAGFPDQRGAEMDRPPDGTELRCVSKTTSIRRASAGVPRGGLLFSQSRIRHRA